MERMKRWYVRMAFREKVLLSFLIVSLVPVIILGLFSFLQTRKILIRREEEVLRETLNQSVIMLDSAMESYKNVMENLVWDTMIKQTLAVRYENNYQMYLAYRDVIDPTILRVKNLNQHIQQISIYSSNPTLYAHGNNLMSIKELEKLSDIEDYQIHWVTDGGRVLELYCCAYPEISQDKNVIYIKVNYDAAFGSIMTLFDGDYGVLVVDEWGKPVFEYASFQGEDGEYALEADEILGGSNRLGQYVMQQETIPVNGWNVYIYRPLAVVSAAVWSITLLTALVILLCVAAILIMGLALTGSVVRPLKELECNMDSIEEGNLAVTVKGNDRDEIGRLISRFDKMVQRLNYMVNEVYESRVAQKEYEMRALQAQINPHFLYNSLSLINWKAIMAGQEEISEMSQLLSTFYRTTLNKGKNVTRVKDEWDNVCSYARIQNMLHSGRLHLKMTLDEGLEDYSILNLLLQPLVENAIVHGLDYKTGQGEKILAVTGRKEESRLIFSVGDNGCGIPQKKLEHLLTVESGGYGVQNVHQRIQLYYGTEFGLSFESREGEGTQVTLCIPCWESEQD